MNAGAKACFQLAVNDRKLEAYATDEMRVIASWKLTPLSDARDRKLEAYATVS
jgi:hypothetical protein